MRQYELALVLRPDLEEEAVDGHIERFSGIITTQGGQPGEIQKWGRRHLAYEIAGHKDGVYVFIPFQAEADASQELEHALHINEDVIRHLITRSDEE